MGQPKQILICDDDEQILMVLSDEVIDAGYQPTTVQTGQACLEQAKRTSPDLIVLDIHLPDISGLNVCQQLKTSEETKHIPIIFVSALADYDDILRGYELGGDDYLTKPIDLNETRIKIKHILERVNQVKKLQGKIASLSEMANITINEASYIGAVAHFATETAFENNYDALANELIEVLERFNLTTKIITFSKFSGEMAHANEPINDEERSLMLSSREIYLADQSELPNRFQTMKDHIISHCENAVIMTFPLPTDELQVGQLRDVLGHISALYSTRINDVDHTKTMGSFIDTNKQVVQGIHSAMDDIKGAFLDQGNGMLALIDNLLQQFEAAVHELYLTDDQEKKIFTILEHAMQQITTTYTASLEIDRRLKNIMSEVQSVSGV